MGGGASKPDPLDIMIEKNLKLTMEKLGLTKKDILPLWKEFHNIDLDKTGHLNLDEIFMSHKIPETEWGRRVFMEIDIDDDGKLSFPEFVVGFYNYLAADQAYLQKMAFDMADEEERGKLSVDQLRQLLITIHGKGPEKKSAKELNKKVHAVMKAMDPQKTGWVTFAAWQKNSKVAASIFKPAEELQQQLRKAYFGKKFWKKATAHRLACIGNQNLLRIHEEFYHLPTHHTGPNSFNNLLKSRASAREDLIKKGEYNSDSDDED